jgi:hypothetical protein
VLRLWLCKVKFIPSYILTVWRLIKHKDNLTDTHYNTHISNENGYIHRSASNIRALGLSRRLNLYAAGWEILCYQIRILITIIIKASHWSVQSSLYLHNLLRNHFNITVISLERNFIVTSIICLQCIHVDNKKFIKKSFFGEPYVMTREICVNGKITLKNIHSNKLWNCEQSWTILDYGSVVVSACFMVKNFQVLKQGISLPA